MISYVSARAAAKWLTFVEDRVEARVEQERKDKEKEAQRKGTFSPV